MAETIGKGVTATLPILWVCMICAAFAHPQGLVFIVHFRRPVKQVSLAGATNWPALLQDIDLADRAISHGVDHL